MHLGFPKTGTTTIQEMFVINAGRLGDGVVVSPKDDLTAAVRRAAVRLMRTGSRLWRWRHGRAANAMRRRIDAMTFDTLIISDENMIGFSSDKLFDPAISQDYSGMVGRIDAALTGYDVTYIIYTRDAGPWQNSAYNQAFKMRRGAKPSYAVWKKTHDNLAGPDDIIASLRAVLGERLHVVRMEEELGADRLMGRAVLDQAGVAPERIAAIHPPPRKNESLPESAMELLRLIHDQPALRGRRYRLLERLFTRHPECFSREFRRQDEESSEN